VKSATRGAPRGCPLVNCQAMRISPVSLLLWALSLSVSSHRERQISERKIRMTGNAQTGLSTVAQLLARRWQEGRSYFALAQNPRGARLHSSWLRQVTDAGLDPRWCPPVLRNCRAASAVIREFADASDTRQ
jgi:hypothetical protein